MRRPIFSLLALTYIILVASSANAVQKVAPRWGYFEFGGSYSSPIGSYSRIFQIDFLDFNDFPRELDADDVFDPSGGFHVGFGQMRNNQVMFGVSYYFTKVNAEDQFIVETDAGTVTYEFTNVRPSFALHDLVFDVNFLPVAGGAAPTMVSPYVGLGFKAGLLAQRAKGFDSEFDASIALALNFGLEIRFSPPTRDGYFALASVNSFDIVGSNERPRFLNFGGALRYYWK